MPSPTKHRILIIDNYDSYTFNLYQYFTGCDPVVIRNDQFKWTQFTDLVDNFDAIVISPGPGRPETKTDFGICSTVLLECPLPILGVCLGHQGLAAFYGGKVEEFQPVHGRTSPIYHDKTGLFQDIPSPFNAVRYHSLIVDQISDQLEIICTTNNDVIMGLKHISKPIWSVQFHPESICTQYGRKILDNFLGLVRDYWKTCPRPNRIQQVESSFDSITAIPKPLHPKGKVTHYASILEVKTDLSALQVFTHLFESKKYNFWLDSAKLGKGARFSYMGDISGPLGCVYNYDRFSKTVTMINEEKEEQFTVDSFFEFISKVVESHRVWECNPSPFIGGLVGYFGYEMKDEILNSDYSKISHNHDSSFLFADRIIIFDHEEDKVYTSEISKQPHVSAWNQIVQEKLDDFKNHQFTDETPKKGCKVSRYFFMDDREDYMKKISASLEKIRHGETYEVCLTTRLMAEMQKPHPHPWEMYKDLRKRNPAPYGAYLSLDKTHICSSSPERFIKIEEHGRITMKPIKGTMKKAIKGSFPGTATEIEAENASRILDLKNSEKDRAENLMIVDLIRNDLNLISMIDSVSVPKLFDVESYATVHQLVTTVQSQLRPDMNAVDAVMRTFPPGSMTGAPKRRTCQIISQLESSARGIYSGCLGYFSLNGPCDFSVVIRTCVFTDLGSHTNFSLGAGGAIVTLSDPGAEYDEMQLKAESVLPSFRAVYQ